MTITEKTPKTNKIIARIFEKLPETNVYKKIILKVSVLSGGIQ